MNPQVVNHEKGQLEIPESEFYSSPLTQKKKVLFEI